MIDRDKMILERCAGKKVLHVGCCATPGCRMMAESGRLLHLKLRGVASQLWGLDMSSEDITYLEEEHRFENLVVGDAQKIDQSFPSETAFDVIVAGELIEHLNNPGQFLDGAHSLLAPEGSLIVSVPNGVTFFGGLKSLLGKETVHQDHNFYFSRKTLSHLLESCGYEMVEIYGYRMKDKSITALVDLFASMFSQWACEGVVAMARPSPARVSAKD